MELKRYVLITLLKLNNYLVSTQIHLLFHDGHQLNTSSGDNRK